MPPPEIRQARVAVSAMFAVHGAVFGTFATRIPWIAEHVDAGPGALGFALIAPALGAMSAMPVAAKLSHRYRSRPTLIVLMIGWCAALVLPALATNIWTLFGALLIYGATSGMADVAMNAQGVVVEQSYGRSIMSGLHGLWSAGGLAASGVGVLAAASDLDGRLHFGAMALVLSIVSILVGRWLRDERLPGEEAPAFALPSRPVLLVGLIGFCAVFAEGGTADWCAVYLQQITGANPATAALSFTAFAFAMTTSRLVGDQIIRRLGPVRTVRLGGSVATCGAVLVLLARQPVLAIAGFTLIGVGVAIVVPLAFAAAGTIGTNPGQAIAGIATIAYGAGLAAPGAIGGIAEATSLSWSFGVVAVLCLILVLGAGALRPARQPHVAKPVLTIES